MTLFFFYLKRVSTVSYNCLSSLRPSGERFLDGKIYNNYSNRENQHTDLKYNNR